MTSDRVPPPSRTDLMAAPAQRNAGRLRSTSALPRRLDRLSPAAGSGFPAFLALILLFAFVPWVVGGYVFLGFAVTGWAWIAGLVLGVFALVLQAEQLSFPIRVIMPWIAVLLGGWIVGRGAPDSAQSLVQLLSPIAVGCAASCFRITSSDVARVRRWLDLLPLLILFLVLLQTPLLLQGQLQTYGSMSAGGMTAALFASVYAAFYGCGQRRYLIHYGLMLIVPVVWLIRGPLVGLAAALPLTLAPLGFARRALLVVAMGLVGLGLLSTERFQKRMFYSGRGTLSDLSLRNTDLSTSGRTVMWSTLWQSAEKRPLLGHGLNASRTVLLKRGFNLYLPHNDWLKIWHDLGLLGVGACLFMLVSLPVALVRYARRTDGNDRLFAFAAASAFIPYILIMFTDNVTLYAQFYGNIHFAFVGLAFARRRMRERSPAANVRL